MKRAIWCLFVPGNLSAVVIWLGFAIWNIFGNSRPLVAALDLILFALNAYSWDYQRRRDGGAP